MRNFFFVHFQKFVLLYYWSFLMCLSNISSIFLSFPLFCHWLRRFRLWVFSLAFSIPFQFLLSPVFDMFSIISRYIRIFTRFPDVDRGTSMLGKKYTAEYKIEKGKSICQKLKMGKDFESWFCISKWSM